MATIPDITATPLSGLNYIDALLDSGPDWNFLTPAANVIRYTFSLASGTEANMTGQEAFTTSQQAATRTALGYISQVTGIQFVETSTGTDAEIHLCNINLTPSNVTGLCSWYSKYGYSGNQLTSYDANAYVYLDNVEWRAANMNLTPGTQGYETLLHELGHALGLKHPFETISDNTAVLPAAQDNTANTLMSYNHSGSAYHSSFQQYDIAALNWLYGGDGLGGSLGINSTTGGRYFTGTTGADTLIGTAANDKFQGNGGNDMIDGGAGTDTVTFRNDRSDYTFSLLGNGDLQASSVDGSDGTSILRSIEMLQFGSASAISAAVVTADTTPPLAPLLTVAKNTNGYASGATPTVTGSGEAGATIKIYTAGNVQVGTATVDANGLWTTKLSAYANGLNYQVYAVATDAAGNVSEHSSVATFNIDATPPSVPTVKQFFIDGGNQAAYSGTGEAGTEIQLLRLSDLTDIAHATVGSNGKWSVITSAMPEGQYDVRAVSVDVAGNATSSSETVSLTVYSNMNVSGTNGNDKLVAPGADNNAIDGRDGLDTVVYAGGRAGYTVAKEVWGFGVIDKVGNGGHDAVINVERLQFDDGAIALDIDGNAGQIYRLYQAVLDRPAEEAGLGYWISRMDKGDKLADLAYEFSLTPEYREKFGANSSNDEFVTKLYNNTLHRDPDADGFKFWLDALDSGTSRQTVMVNFSESIENQAQVIGSIQNGMKYVPYLLP
jgi:serralysin